MPNIKSAKKRVLVSRRRNLENVAKKTRVKNATKKFYAAVDGGDLVAAKTLLSEAVSVIDRAASDGVFHKNAASRKKATLCRKYDAAVKQAG
jgi:small subunit ribosomal protein S20